MGEDAIVIICTRPDSSRLPRKCFLPIAGVPVIEHILHRLRETGLTVILAIPIGCEQDYAAYSNNTAWPKVYTFAGQADSPLHRMARALDWYSRHNPLPQYVVRITHDDPLIDAQELMTLVRETKNAKAGYGKTEKILIGAGAEVFATANILAAAAGNGAPVEHLTYFARGGNMPNPSEFYIDAVPALRSNHRMCLDYFKDYAVLRATLAVLGPWAKNEEIINFLNREENLKLSSMNRLPDVTVYTCAYNAEKFIEQTLASVPWSATLNFLEYIIIDDFSTDGTMAKVLNLKEDRRIDYTVRMNTENKGLSSCCNIALSMARGKYILRLDADDILDPGAIDKMVSAMKQTDAAIVYSAFNEFGSEDGRLTRKSGDAHHAGCALMNAEILREIKFTEGLRNWDSLDIYLKVSKRFKTHVMPDDQPLWNYRVRPDSMSRTNLEQREIERKKIEERHADVGS